MVLAMNPKAKPHIFLWVGFVASALLTWVVDFNMWYSPSFYVTLDMLATIQFAFGFSLLLMSHFYWRTVIFVVIGSIIGQLWLVQMGLMFFAWSINGFAP
jgi:hypothetical protein